MRNLPTQAESWSNMIYTGGCHCGAVRFEVEVPKAPESEYCNCSICTKSGYQHLIVPAASFTLLTDPAALHTYTFNKGIAQHKFCKTCGIKSFYIPRTNPDGIDVNVNCLDQRPPDLKVVQFDGQNWEQHGPALAHKSRQT